MRPSKFTEDQTVEALQQVKDGTPAVQVCRTLDVTQTTFYRWRKKYDGVVAGEPHDMRELRSENQKLKQIIARLLLDQMP